LKKLNESKRFPNHSGAASTPSECLAAARRNRSARFAYGGRFFLTGLHETMRSIFETSRLDQIFQILPDVDAALAAG